MSHLPIANTNTPSNNDNYFNPNRIKRALKLMRNATFHNINDLDIIDIRYDAPYFKELKSDASFHITREENDNSDLPQPITDEMNLLQQPETTYTPYSEKLSSTYAYDSNSIPDTENDFSVLPLPITHAVQSDVTNDEWPPTPGTTYTYNLDVPLGTNDISLSKYTENIESDETTETDTEEMIITTTTKIKVTKITPKEKVIKIRPKVKFNNILPKVNKLTNSSKNSSNINNKNNNIIDNINAFCKFKEKCNEKTVAVYLDELLHFKNNDIQTQPNNDDNEEVVVYIDDELRSTSKVQSPITHDKDRNPLSWLEPLKFALNFIATKSHKIKANETLHSVRYTKNNSDVVTDLGQSEVPEVFDSESSTVAYDYESTKEMSQISDEISNNIDFTPSYLKSGNDIKVPRRTRDIKSIDFDIEREIKDTQDINRNDFNKPSKTKSSTTKATIFSDYKVKICPPKELFSKENYSNLRDKNMGSNIDPKIFKVNEGTLESADTGKHRVKRNAQSYTETILQTVKADLDPQLVTQSQLSQYNTDIQNLTTQTPLKEGKRDKDLNAIKINIGDFFQMVSEWFGTLAGVAQLNKTDSV